MVSAGIAAGGGNACTHHKSGRGSLNSHTCSWDRYHYDRRIALEDIWNGTKCHIAASVLEHGLGFLALGITHPKGNLVRSRAPRSSERASNVSRAQVRSIENLYEQLSTVGNATVMLDILRGEQRLTLLQEYFH